MKLIQVYKVYQAEHSYENNNYIDSINIRDSANLIYAIENKLESLGLIDTGRYEQVIANINHSIMRRLDGMSPSNSGAPKPRSEVTTFGNDFLEFFNLLDKYRI